MSRVGGKGDAREAGGLRQRAEDALETTERRVPVLEVRDVPRLVHELTVHQVEFEMQNEELLETRAGLEESRDRYQALYDHAPVGYVTLDRHGRILQANLMTSTLLGVPRAQLSRRPLAAFCAAPSGDVLYLHCRALFETGLSQSGQIRVESGHRRCDLRIESRLDASGERCHMVLVDVAERETARAELERARADLEERVLERTVQLTRLNEALTQSEARFRLLADNARDVVFRYRLKPSPGFEYLSPSIAGLTGHSPDEFVRDPGLAVRLVAPSDRESADRLLSGDASMDEVELRLRDRDGEERWCETRASRVTDAGGQVVAIEGIAREITERKVAQLALRRAHDELEQRVAERTASLARANEALVGQMTRRRQAEAGLREREARLRSLVETTVDGIIRIDAVGLVESFNPAAERIFGRAAGDVLGQSIRGLLDESGNVVSVLHFAQDGAVRVRGSSGELLGRRGDGSTVPLEISVGEVRDGRKGFICVVRDVSERRRLEQELRQSQKMEAIGALASGVAHDFNNLLQGIIGCADLALGRLSADSPAKTYVDLLKSAARSGAGVVGQLMDFSHRSERGRETLDVNQLLSSRDTLLRRLVGEDVTVCVTLGPETAPVCCEPAQLEQALMNLVVNARQAMPRGGRLELETGAVELGEGRSHPALEPGRYVTLTVRDTGHGMDLVTQRRAFEPFFTTKGYGKGTGLGLSSVYAMVSGAGGTIDLSSSLGEGSTFTIYLPRSTDPVRSTGAEPSVGSERAGETVLLAEDEPLVLASVQYYLERHGYRVLTARNADEARTVLEEQGDRVDLVLTDVVLPDGSAPDVVLAARSRRPDVRVLYMSAFSRSDLGERYGLGGDETTLQKPVSEQELLSGVRDALRQSWGPPPGEGARRPEIPAVPKAPALASDTGSGPASHGRVLLVEDEQVALMAAREVLEDEGYVVTVASTGEAALDVWQRRQGAFDVVIADCRLSGMRGTSMLDRMRRDRPDLPAVLMSAQATDDVKAWLERARRTVFLEKPFELSQVIEEIASLLG